MWAVAWKELRELSAVAMTLWVVGAIVAASEIAGRWNRTEDMVVAALTGGIAFGLGQGVLDQVRRNDAFLKHRPLSAGRLQLARTGAGLFVVIVAVVVFFASLWIATAVEIAELARIRGRIGDNDFTRQGPMFYGAWTHVMVAALAIGSWTLGRFVGGLRPMWLVVPAALVLPFAAWAPLSRAADLGAATLLAAGFALLFGGLVHARETRAHGVVARVLLLGVLGLVFFEGALWVRSGLADAQRQVLPRFGMMEDGTMRYWRYAWPDGLTEVSGDHGTLRRWPDPRDADAPPRSVATYGSIYGEDDTLAYEQLDDARFVPDYRATSWGGPGWGDRIAALLTREQRMLWYADPASRGHATVQDQPQWSYRGGRLVCWRAALIEGMAWVGPEGFHEGKPLDDAPRFPDDARVVSLDEVGEAEALEHGPWRLADLRGGRSWYLRLDPKRIGDPTAPIPIEVSDEPFTPYEGDATGPPVVLAEGRRIWLADPRHGLSAPHDLRPDEYVPRAGRRRSYEPQIARLETWLMPQHPVRYGVRLRAFRKDGSVVIGEARLQPRTFWESLPEAGMGLIAVVRPPVLNAWAFVSDGPKTRSEMNRWWWRDPFFSSRSYLGWLLASLALGVLSALLAWRSVRLRLPTRAAQLRWVVAVFLLGPLGLWWMGRTLGRVAVRPVGEGRRAVDLVATPDNPTPWPEPAPRGTEVFARTGEPR